MIKLNKCFFNKNLMLFLLNLSFILLMFNISSNSIIAKSIDNNKDKDKEYYNNQQSLMPYMDTLKKINDKIINLKLSSKEKSLFYSDINKNLSKLKGSIDSKESVDVQLDYLKNVNTLLSKSFKYSYDNKDKKSLDTLYGSGDEYELKFEIVADDYYNIFKLNKELLKFQELDKNNYIRYNLELIHLYDKLHLELLAFNSIHNITNEISKNIYEYKDDVLDILNIIQENNIYSLVFKKELKELYSLVLYSIENIDRYNINNNSNDNEYIGYNKDSDYNYDGYNQKLTNSLNKQELEKIEYIKLYLSKGFIHIEEYDIALLELEKLLFTNNKYIQYLSKYFISCIYKARSNDKESRAILESIFNDKKEVDLYFSILDRFYADKNKKYSKNTTDTDHEYFVFDDNKYEDVFYLELAVNDLATYYIKDSNYVEALNLLSRINEDSIVDEDIYYTKIYIHYLLKSNDFELLSSAFLVKYPYSYRAYQVKLMLASYTSDKDVLTTISNDIKLKIKDVETFKKGYFSIGNKEDFNDTTIYNLNISKLFNSIEKYIILEDNEELSLGLERNILSSKKILDKVLQNNLNDINKKVVYLNSLNNSTFYVEDILKIASQLLKEKYDLIYNSVEDKYKIKLLDKVKNIENMVNSTRRVVSKEKLELKMLLSFLSKDLYKISDQINYDTVNKIIDDLYRYIQDTRFLENIESTSKLSSNANNTNNLKTETNVYINKVFIKDFIDKVEKYFYEFDSNSNLNSDLKLDKSLNEKISNITSKFEKYKNIVNQTLVDTESFELYLEQEIITVLSDIKDFFVSISDMNESLYHITYSYKKGIKNKLVFENFIRSLDQKLLSLDIEKQNISFSNFRKLNEDIILNNEIIDLLKRGKTR